MSRQAAQPRTRLRTRLTDAQGTAIATAPEGSSIAELARQLGCHYTTVANAVQRLRQGWSCLVEPARCLVCSGPLLRAVAAGRRTVHPGCKPERVAAMRRDATLRHEPAKRSREPWRAEEDAYVLAHTGEPAREVARHLGRSVWAVHNRRMVLRRQG